MTTVMPERIAKLPRDRRGYPIPYNVLRGNDGAPIFTVNDSLRHMTCLIFRLCPICGEAQDSPLWFVGGPRSAFDEHGWYLDLPGHRECITFALAVCPYLALPNYLGRIDVPDPAKLPQAAILFDDTMIPERPEVFVAVQAAGIFLRERGPGASPYVKPMNPMGVEYWRHGQRLGQEEGEALAAAAMATGWQPPAWARGDACA